MQVGRLKDQIQKLNDEKDDFQLREAKLLQENSRYNYALTCSVTQIPHNRYLHFSYFRSSFILYLFLFHVRLDRQMRELKEEMTVLSRQEEEHKKRKVDSVSIPEDTQNCKLADHAFILLFMSLCMNSLRMCFVLCVLIYQ